MNSLREIIESSPSVRHLAFANKSEGDEPQALAPARWDWSEVRRILVVRLRSIGDTVLTTPSLYALRRFLNSISDRSKPHDQDAPDLGPIPTRGRQGLRFVAFRFVCESEVTNAGR